MRTATQQAQNETSTTHETSSARLLSPKPALPSPGYTGNRAALRRLSQASPRLQCKLTIGAVNDPLEAEADRVADQVMRMPDPMASGEMGPAGRPIVQRACAECEREKDIEETVQRQSAESTGSQLPSSTPPVQAVGDRATIQRDMGPAEIEDQLVHAYLGQTDTVQRQADQPEAEPASTPAEEDETTQGEQILMQAKSAGGQSVNPGRGLESEIQSLEGSGAPLPTTVRQHMEPRFGHDFSDVRIHANSRAAELARAVNARAFTIGRNVVFASGEYAPDSSGSSRHLLAHELTHVIQQGQAGAKVQRKIVVGGSPYTPSAKYLAFLNTTFGPAMKEFVEQMHNGGNPPVYSFSSYEQMGNEVRVRAKAIQGIEQVHQGCCGYYGVGDPPHLDPAYWDQVGSGVDFKLKSPLPAGKNPSDAIEAIFAPGAHTRLECLSMTIAIEYYSILKGQGAAKFNALFPAGIEIAVGATQPLVKGPDKKYDIVTLASKSEILPGDWVYFKNFHDYIVKNPGGYWTGENAIALGGGKFRGFGVGALTEDGLNQELVRQYNLGAGPPPKTVADLIADGGGLLLNPVVRPIIAKVAP
jgi:hypothetical protein